MEEYTKYYKTNIESMQDIVKTVGLMLKFDIIKIYMNIETIVTKFLSKYGNVEFIKTLFWLILPVIYACLKG